MSRQCLERCRIGDIIVWRNGNKSIVTGTSRFYLKLIKDDTPITKEYDGSMVPIHGLLILGPVKIIKA